MSSRIIILDDAVANKIAAGEVIERPASVVKELVENAIDAGATHVEVALEEGGRRLVAVTDDGEGMTAEEAVLALQRHATSKIRQADDLFAIRTLGFRGEALPSIAAVSHFRLTTRARGEPAGARLQVEGGIVTEMEEVGVPEGTEVRVAGLFYNTPARLKFLRSEAAELSRITELLWDFGFACPALSLRLTHNANEVLRRPAAGDLRSAIGARFGHANLDQFLNVNFTSGPIRVSGCAAVPGFHRASRSQERFFVNGRPIASRLLTHALEEAYHTLLPQRRYPAAVIMLEIEPGLVDVNVHPAKAEVRFYRESEVHHAVNRAVREALDRGGLAPQAELRAATPAAIRPAAPAAGPVTPDLLSPPSAEPEPARGSTTAPRRIPPPAEPAAGPAPPRAVAALRPLAQLRATYLLAEGEQGLVVVDQHRAHERVLYERFLTEMTQAAGQSQGLVVPITLEFGSHEASVLEQNAAELAALGFDFEPFGGNSFLLRAVPPSVARQAPEAFVRDLVEELASQSPPRQMEERRERAATVMACKSAVKAGQTLALEEMVELCAQLLATTRPFTCPHGRPTMMTVSNYELDRKFYR
jgi:DNA mismatch repair protein MutL